MSTMNDTDNHETSGIASTGNKITDALATITIEGDLIPRSWYSDPLFKFKNGRTNYIAIAAAARIVYWYRPSEETNPKTKQITYSKKFRKDMLQKSYEELASEIGATKEQARAACRFLESRGLLKLYFRKIKVNGVPQNNVLFLEPSLVAMDTLSGSNGIGVLSEPDRCPVPTGEVSGSDQTPVLSRPDTSLVRTGDEYIDYTETTPEITPETSTEQFNTSQSQVKARQTASPSGSLMNRVEEQEQQKNGVFSKETMLSHLDDITRNKEVNGTRLEDWLEEDLIYLQEKEDDQYLSVALDIMVSWITNNTSIKSLNKLEIMLLKLLLYHYLLEHGRDGLRIVYDVLDDTLRNRPDSVKRNWNSFTVLVRHWQLNVDKSKNHRDKMVAKEAAKKNKRVEDVDTRQLFFSNEFFEINRDWFANVEERQRMLEELENREEAAEEYLEPADAPWRSAEQSE